MITIKILVLNVGSSSLKYRFYDMENEICLFRGHIDGIGLERCKISYYIGDEKPQEEARLVKTHKEAVKTALKSLTNHNIIDSWKEIDAIGHRVVHGGDYFKEAAFINNSNISYINIFSELAPLHNPPQLNAIVACRSYMPDIKQVAVFDTAFHQSIPDKAFMYGLPLDIYKKHKIRKYGFHGTSHKYLSGEAIKLLKNKKNSKVIVCHLGSGSSITAVLDGQSYDTSMGFTPLDGLVMGTRSGSFDPAVVLYMIKNLKMKPDEIQDMLEHKSGFMGMTQMVSDMRDVHGLSEKKNAKAIVAKEKFIHQAVSYIGGYAAVMNGVDAIVFSAGIGEGAEYIRSEICDSLSFLGVKIDSRKNRSHKLDISTPTSNVKVFVIPTNEEIQIARETKEKIEPFIK